MAILDLWFFFVPESVCVCVCVWCGWDVGFFLPFHSIPFQWGYLVELNVWSFLVVPVLDYSIMNAKQL